VFVVVVRLTVSAQSWVIKARVSVRGYIRVKVRGQMPGGMFTFERVHLR